MEKMKKIVEIAYSVLVRIEGHFDEEDLNMLINCMEFKLKGATVTYNARGIAEVIKIRRHKRKPPCLLND